VEDNLVNQKVVSKQLRKAGHVVYVANHGEEALDFIKRSEYWHTVATGQRGRGKPLSVVLMDLEMPIMDGTTCVKKIREWQAEGRILGHIPVIAVTANARKDQIVASLEAGMVRGYFINFGRRISGLISQRMMSRRNRTECKACLSRSRGW
jgi:CheY-like chemotaxis protein